MRAKQIIRSILVVALMTLFPSLGLAGIYNPGQSIEERMLYPSFLGPGDNFKDVISKLRVIPLDKDRPSIEVWFDNPVRQRYALMERVPLTSLKTVEEKLQMSAVFLRRRGKGPENAISLLKPYVSSPEERDNVAVLSNYATALHFKGELLDAWRTLDGALKEHWKTPWADLPAKRQAFFEGIGWTQSDYELNRIYDTYYAKLLRLRFVEQKQKKGPVAVVQPPDAIFDGGKDPRTPVKFVGESGEFTAGKIAAAEKAKLPNEPKDIALPIVQQLVVWMPDDMRLYWLLGEMYNAQGGKQGIAAAHQIFTELDKIAAKDSAEAGQLKRRIGILQAALEEIQADEERALNTKIDKTTKDDGLPLDWRAMAVSFGVGFLLALFVVWQVREIQRRRASRAP